MCFGPSPKAPTPPPLPAPPPPPDPLETEVNPQVKRAKSKKDKNPYSKGTSSLRIKLDPAVNTGQATGQGGGLNV